MNFAFFKFSQGSKTPEQVGRDLDQNFRQIENKFFVFSKREFINTTTASVTRTLPDGRTSPSPDYTFTKTDATANTVTIYPFNTAQFVMGTTSVVLAIQGATVTLSWDPASQSWWGV